MEIDTRLQEFKRDISPNINNLFRESKALTDKLSDFKTVNDSASDALDTSFKSEGIKALKEEITYTNSVATAISESIFNELNTILDKCKILSVGIDDLEALLDEYKIVFDSKDENEIKSYEIIFTDKQEELLKIYNEITNADFYNKLMYFDVDSISNNGRKDNNFIQEKDGTFYQKSMPIYRGKKYELINDINVIYDMKKILQADKEAGKEAVNYLRSLMKNSTNNASLWDYQKNKYINNSGIAKVMNVVLEDSYVANKCSSISSYAAVAALVLSDGLVDLKYGSSPSDSTSTLGFDKIINNGSSLSNTEFICWAYNQGLLKTSNKLVEEEISTNICLDHSKDVSSITFDELCKLPIGTCLIKKVRGKDQIGMVVGYTKVNEDLAVVVAGALSNKNGSYSNLYKVKDSFGNDNNKWHRFILASDIEKELRG